MHQSDVVDAAGLVAEILVGAELVAEIQAGQGVGRGVVAGQEIGLILEVYEGAEVATMARFDQICIVEDHLPLIPVEARGDCTEARAIPACQPLRIASAWSWKTLGASL